MEPEVAGSAPAAGETTHWFQSRFTSAEFSRFTGPLSAVPTPTDPAVSSSPWRMPKMSADPIGAVLLDGFPEQAPNVVLFTMST